MSSDPPDSQDEEVTGVTHRAHKGDVLAIKIKHVERKHDTLEKTVKDMKAILVGKDDDAKDGGIRGDISNVRFLVTTLLALLTLTIAGGGFYLALKKDQAPPPPRAEDIAREVIRQQQK